MTKPKPDKPGKPKLAKPWLVRNLETGKKAVLTEETTTDPKTGRKTITLKRTKPGNSNN